MIARLGEYEIEGRVTVFSGHSLVFVILSDFCYQVQIVSKGSSSDSLFRIHINQSETIIPLGTNCL